MNLINFSDHLQVQFKLAINNSNTIEDELLKVGETLKAISATILELKRFITLYQFSSEREQITFFKEIKPVFLSQYYYYQQVFEIRLFDSFKDQLQRKTNYQKILARLERFAISNQDFYQYCLTNATYLDEHYFTIRDQIFSDIEKDDKFSTGFDSRLAKLLANELLKEFIQKLITNESAIGADKKTQLVWTGAKTALVELIYALHASGQFNNGSADINNLASTLSQVFHISLGDYYRTFQDIANRKTGHSKFIDELKMKLLHRINDTN